MLANTPFSALRQGEFAAGQRVQVALKDGERASGDLVYVRMDHLNGCKHPAAVSVRLDGRSYGPDGGTLFPAGDVFTVDNRDAALERQNKQPRQCCVQAKKGDWDERAGGALHCPECGRKVGQFRQ